MRLFVDTGPLVALANAGDRHHEDAASILRRIASGEWSSVHTSDHVVAEALNFTRAKLKRREAAQIVIEAVFGGTEPPVVTSVLRVHAGRFAAAMDRYRRRFDAGLSFTDWSSLVVMEEERIGEIATFDAGFRPFASVVG